MKIMKKTFYCLLILIILFPISSPCVFSASSTKLQYLALGDSIAEGYGLSNTEKKDTRYSGIISKQKSYDETNLAVSGMTCKEFYNIISTNSTYQIAIQNADILTISIGSNELLDAVVTVIKNAMDVTDAQTRENAIAKASQNFKEADLTKKIIMLKKLAIGFSSDATRNNLANGVDEYHTYWKKSINEINKLKKTNSIIVVTEFYNPYRLGKLGNLINKIGTLDNSANSYINSSGELANSDIGVLFDSCITQMNQILNSESNNQSNYKIASIKNTFDTHNYFGKPKYINVSILPTNFSLDPHPNYNGHMQIANSILPYLETSTTQQNYNEQNSNNSQNNNNSLSTRNLYTNKKANIYNGWNTAIIMFITFILIILVVMGIYIFFLYKKH